LARFAETLPSAQMTHRGMILGTPGYMSPEHLGGDSSLVGPRADVYSLGVIFYELLTGQLPFHSPLAQLVKQILLDPPPPPSTIVRDVPPILEAICLKMIAKDPNGRHANMKHVAEELAAFLRNPLPGAGQAVSATSMAATIAAPGIPRDESRVAYLPVPEEENLLVKRLQDALARRRTARRNVAIVREL